MHEYITTTSLEVLLEDIGVRELNATEVQAQYRQLTDAIDTTLDKTNDKIVIPLVRTGIEPVSREQWFTIPAGEQAITCAMGGSSWVVAHAQKQADQSVDLHELSKTTWSRDKKELSFEEFIRLMAEQIARGANTAYIPLLTIALGFPQQPIGRDAVLRPNAMSKGWSMHDLENNRHRPIGAEVRASLQRMGIQVDNYTVLHDATSLAQSAVAHSSTISGGLAAGTGTGGSVVINGEIIDLQPSKLLIESTPILEEMQRRKLISQPMLGQLGGVYTGYTTGIALTKIGEQTPGAQGPLLQALGERLLKEDDAPTVISGVLEGKVTSDDLSQGFGLPISDNELRVLNQIAVPVFSAAGQLYGMVGAAIARYEQPFDTSNLLFEGSMLGKGVGIKDRAEKTAQQLGYPIRFTESSSLTGSAIYGMSQHYASNRLSHRN